MKTHLFFANLAAAIWLVLFAPIAMYYNAEHSIENINILKDAGVIDSSKLTTFAQEIQKPTIATNDKHLENWLNDSSYTNYLLVFPSFMVLLLNALIIMRANFKPTQM